MILGIDGGGTSIKVVCLFDSNDPSPRKLSLNRSGNYLSLEEFELAKIFSEILDKLNISSPSSIKLLIGLAGAGTIEALNQIRSIATRVGFSTTNIWAMTDADIAMKALQDHGILAISGTGSMCLGKIGTRIERAGGWGYLIDNDAGSAFHLGSLVLRHIARAVDGIVDQDYKPTSNNELIEAVLGHYTQHCGRSIDSMLDLRSYLYALPFERHKVSSLAPVIFELAARGHPPSITMLSFVARELAELIATVFHRLKPVAPISLGLWGGMFTNSNSEKLFVTPLLSAPCLSTAKEFLKLVPLYKSSDAECVLTLALRHQFH